MIGGNALDFAGVRDFPERRPCETELRHLHILPPRR